MIYTIHARIKPTRPDPTEQPRKLSLGPVFSVGHEIDPDKFESLWKGKHWLDENSRLPRFVFIDLRPEPPDSTLHRPETLWIVLKEDLRTPAKTGLSVRTCSLRPREHIMYTLMARSTTSARMSNVTFEQRNSKNVPVAQEPSLIGPIVRKNGTSISLEHKVESGAVHIYRNKAEENL